MNDYFKCVVVMIEFEIEKIDVRVDVEWFRCVFIYIFR